MSRHDLALAQVKNHAEDMVPLALYWLPMSA